MPNINELLSKLNNPKTDLSKNVFEPSASHVYSMPIGAVLPLNPIHTVPQGKYRLSFDELIHTRPFVTDPFLRLSKHIDVWFVPFSAMNHAWENFISQSDEFTSSAGFSATQGTPVFTMATLMLAIQSAFGSHAKDSMGYDKAYGMLRLLDLLGYGTYMPSDVLRWTQEEIMNKFSYELNAWNILAYNAIWNYAYRDKHHTTSLDPAWYNVDAQFIQGSSAFDAASYLMMRYRRGRSDVFRSSQTSRQFGSVQSVELLNFELYLANPNEVDTDITGSTSNFLGVPKNHPEEPFTLKNGTNQQSVELSIPNAFDVYALKRAEMLQKYNEQLGRAGKDINSRALAIYGISPRSISKDFPVFVGSTSFDVVASQVTSTGEGANTQLGDIAAKGIGYTQQNSMDFDCTEFGVLMPVTYLLPTNFYGNTGFDKVNTYIDRFDYFTPQLQNLGLEEIVGGNISSSYVASGGSELVPYTNTMRNEVIGYLPRYWPYKSNYDKAHQGFGRLNGDNEIWAPTNAKANSTDNSESSYARPYLRYYVNPSDYDVLFGVSYDGSPLSDPFICNCRVNVRAVLPMSELGLVNW